MHRTGVSISKWPLDADGIFLRPFSVDDTLRVDRFTSVKSFPRLYDICEPVSRIQVEGMEYIDLRTVGREGLKEIRRQVVRLKKMGKTGKEIRSTPESRQRNMDSVSARGRSLLREKKVWAQARNPHGAQNGRTSGYSKGNRGKKTRGFRNHRAVVDVRANEAVHPKTVSQGRK